VTRDEHAAEVARLEQVLGAPAQIRSAAGRFVANRPADEVLKSLAYHRAEIARLDAETLLAGGPRTPRQVRVVYGGRGY
jgi:hypothetical protein